MIITPANDTEATIAKADSMLNRYDLNIEVPEHKRYLDEADIIRMKEVYNSPDISGLAEKVEDWTGEPGGVDEKGVYVTTTRNPEGHIDSWQLFGPGPVESRMFVHPDAYCSAIIFDDGVWQAAPDVDDMPREEADKIMDKWEADLEETIGASSNKIAIIARCHS